jgi:hypothetical protein
MLETSPECEKCYNPSHTTVWKFKTGTDMLLLTSTLNGSTMKVRISVPVIFLLKPGHRFMSPNWNESQTNSNIQAAHMYANFSWYWLESKCCLFSCMVLMMSFSTRRSQGAKLPMQSSPERFWRMFFQNCSPTPHIAHNLPPNSPTSQQLQQKY